MSLFHFQSSNLPTASLAMIAGTSSSSSSSVLASSSPWPNGESANVNGSDKKGSINESVLEVQVQRDVSGDVIDHGLRRGLKGRQFVIIALGSIIGPGTFYGLGYALYLSGPLGLLIGFALVGVSSSHPNIILAANQC